MDVCVSRGAGALRECGAPLAVLLERALSTQAGLPQLWFSPWGFRSALGLGDI